MFHRLAVPTYFGGLPLGFDYLNNPALSGGTGVPVAMDNRKAGGPNDGTYGVAFGEDASSNFANRGIKALGENTDLIDDILRRDLAITARTDDVLAVAPVSSVIFTGGQGDVFVGAFGLPNNQANRDLLISVLDDSDNEIIDLFGAKVVASSIVDNNILSTNLVGTQASGFFNSPTVNFTPPIPAGTTYRIYYGERSNLATLPMDAFTTIKIRGAQEVNADIEKTLRDLHTTGGTQAWDAPWDATIKALATAGLNGIYRRSTVEADFSPYNVPGSGASIFRDGIALTMRCRNIDLQNNGIGALTPYPDPVLACYRITLDSPSVTAGYDTTRGGNLGLYQESPYHNTFDINEGAFGYVAGPLLLETISREIAADTLSGAGVVSRITPSTVALLNPDAGALDIDRATVQVGAGDYIWDGSHNQAIRYTDLIEVTDDATGDVIGTYGIQNFTTQHRIVLQALTGITPRLGPNGASYNVRLRWIQPTISIGGRLRAALNDSGMNLPHFAVCAPSMLTDSMGTEHFALNAAFFAADSNYNVASARGTSLAWGGFDTSSGHWGLPGRLLGDGSIIASGGVSRLNMFSRNSSGFAVNNGGRSISWNPVFGGSQIRIYSNGPLIGAAPCSFAIDTISGYAPISGDEFDVFIELDLTSTGPMTMTWPVDFIFSGGTDGIIPTSNVPGGPGNPIVTHYHFRYMSTPSLTGWFATRTDF